MYNNYIWKGRQDSITFGKWSQCGKERILLFWKLDFNFRSTEKLSGKYRVSGFSLPPHRCNLPSCQYPTSADVTANEPTMTGHYHPKSIVHLRVHSCCFTFCRFWQMYSGMYIPLQNHTEYFHWPNIPLCSAYLSLLPA